MKRILLLSAAVLSALLVFSCGKKEAAAPAAGVDNETIRTIMSRKSVRSFTGDKLSEEQAFEKFQSWFPEYRRNKELEKLKKDKDYQKQGDPDAGTIRARWEYLKKAGKEKPLIWFFRCHPAQMPQP